MPPLQNQTFVLARRLPRALLSVVCCCPCLTNVADAESPTTTVAAAATAPAASAKDAALDPTNFPLAFRDLFNGRDLAGWTDVNTSPETWSVQNGTLVCTGNPIGVIRSDRQYENFILEIEWRHMKPGGNSGVFLWCDAVPGDQRLPNGMEVQMLELEWIHLNAKNGKPRPVAYVQGELFAAGSMTATPDNPRGVRSKSLEHRCKGHGEWNKYLIVAVDGTVKLSINGKFVNSIRNASLRKGYLCLESEGSEIHFRNLRIMELPPGMANEGTTAALLGDDSAHPTRDPTRNPTRPAPSEQPRKTK